MSNEKDNSSKQLAILVIGVVIFMVLYILTVIYSSNNEVKMFTRAPLCIVPYAELGLAVGIFFGIDKQFAVQTKLLVQMFAKLLIGVIVFEAIRACVTHGFAALGSILALIGDNDDGDLTYAGYSVLNLLISAAAMIAMMFLGRALGKLFQPKDSAE